MTATYSIRVAGQEQLERQLARAMRVIGDLSGLMEAIGLYLESSTLERFDSETAPDGSDWDTSTRARLEGGKTLTDSGQLKASISSDSGRDWAAVGSNKIYAGVHNEGATIKAKTDKGLAFQLPGGLGFRRIMEVELPRRQFLGLSAEDKDEIYALIDDELAMEGAA